MSRENQTPSSFDVQDEGLKFARLLMVLSSLSPLFILWAIRGNSYIPNSTLCLLCGILVITPLAILKIRIHFARKDRDIREVVVGVAEDHRNHVLIYLFSILLPFYRQEMTSLREFVAMIAALSFIILLFWHLNYHYMNVYFAIQRYKIYTISPPRDGNRFSGKGPLILISKRQYLLAGERIHALRISNTVYLEKTE